MGIPIEYGSSYVGTATAPDLIHQTDSFQQLLASESPAVTTSSLDLPSQSNSPVAAISEMIDAVGARVGDCGDFPLFVGGDHTISIASVNAVVDALGEIGLLWVDAHADFNTPETSNSGNIHGMVVSSLLGDGPSGSWEATLLEESNIALLGTRSIDEAEQSRLEESDISMFTMSEIEEHGLQTVCERAWGVVSDGVEGVHVSWDMDVFDPTVAPGVSVPEAGGLSWEDGRRIAEFVKQHDDLLALDVVEVNPLRDQHGKTVDFTGTLIQDTFEE